MGTIDDARVLGPKRARVPDPQRLESSTWQHERRRVEGVQLQPEHPVAVEAQAVHIWNAISI